MSLSAGTKIGPYEIIAAIGAGGMGEVYRARDARLQRDVAIKVLPQSFAQDQERLRRFEQEARATAALNHPNLLAIFDLGQHDGAPYIASELLEGETLRERLRNGPLPARRALDVAQQIARGLAAAHEKGIVHRDLKPENIFLTKDGRVKILDFGLAKLTQVDSSQAQSSLPTDISQTEPGIVLGTAGYMSPEQVRGQAVDARSDIFSFGAILYEMLSGKRAFHGQTLADTMSAILREEPPELAETSRNISPGLERIVRHCLEKNPEARFHSASDVAFALEELTGSSASGAVVAQPRAAKPKRELVMAIGSGALALVMLGIGWLLGGRGAKQSFPKFQQVTFRLGTIGNARFTPDGSIVYEASWDGQPSELYIARTDNPGERDLGIKDANILSISKNGEMAIRERTVNVAGYARFGTLAEVPLSGGTPREVLDNVQDAEWAPNGSDMAVVRFVPENAHWRLEYPVGKVLLDTVGWISEPRISPDGKWVAFADHQNTEGDDEGGVAVIGPDGKEKILATGYSSLQGVLWSPKGDEVWFTSSDSGSVTSARGVTFNGKLRTIMTWPELMWFEDWHDGTALVVAHKHRNNIRALAPGAKEERELGWFGWSEMRDATADLKKILFEEEAEGGGPNYTVFLRDTDGSPPVSLGEGIGQAISPDEKYVVTKPAKGGPLSLVPTGAGEARQLTHDDVNYFNAHFLPDGKRLLAMGIEPGHGARDYVIDVSNGSSHPVTPEGVRGTVFSWDGEKVAVRTPEGKEEIWPLNGGAPQPIPGMDTPGGSFVTGWTADGKSVYVEVPTGEKPGIYLESLAGGKRTFWKASAEMGTAGANGPGFSWFISKDGKSYAYVYSRVLSEAYVVTGLR